MPQETIWLGLEPSSPMLVEYSPEEVKACLRRSTKEGQPASQCRHGVTRRGVLRGDVCSIKFFTCESDFSTAAQHYRREFEVARLLPHHDHLVHLKGFCPELLTLVYEWSEAGSLQDWLLRREDFPWHERLLVSAALSSALLALHGEQPDRVVLLHRDIRLENVWMSSTGQPKLGGYSLAEARFPDEDGSDVVEVVAKGSVGAVDAYYWVNRIYHPACDVGSFAVLLLQLLTGLTAPQVRAEDLPDSYHSLPVLGPGEVMDVENLMRLMISMGQPLEQLCNVYWPPNLAPEVFTLAFKCVHPDLNQRPSTRDLYNTLAVLSGQQLQLTRGLGPEGGVVKRLANQGPWVEEQVSRVESYKSKGGGWASPITSPTSLCTGGYGAPSYPKDPIETRYLYDIQGGTDFNFASGAQNMAPDQLNSSVKVGGAQGGLRASLSDSSLNVMGSRQQQDMGAQGYSRQGPPTGGLTDACPKSPRKLPYSPSGGAQRTHLPTIWGHPGHEGEPQARFQGCSPRVLSALLAEEGSLLNRGPHWGTLHGGLRGRAPWRRTLNLGEALLKDELPYLAGGTTPGHSARVPVPLACGLWPRSHPLADEDIDEAEVSMAVADIMNRYESFLRHGGVGTPDGCGTMLGDVERVRRKVSEARRRAAIALHQYCKPLGADRSPAPLHGAPAQEHLVDCWRGEHSSPRTRALEDQDLPSSCGSSLSGAVRVDVVVGKGGESLLALKGGGAIPAGNWKTYGQLAGPRGIMPMHNALGCYPGGGPIEGLPWVHEDLVLDGADKRSPRVLDHGSHQEMKGPVPRGGYYSGPHYRL